jgi:DNA repair protein RecO (recombination protein O)
MKQQLTTGIVLARTNYGESDRILTVLTSSYGKLHLIAKGVRKERSKLAGGIELFSISNFSFIKGRGDIDTLTSSRLIQHYSHIVGDIERVQLGYELIKLINKGTEDNIGNDYFELLKTALQALDTLTIDENLIRAWFYAQLLRLDGHSPNLRTDQNGQKLKVDQNFNFRLDDAVLIPEDSGQLTTDHVKFLRLIFSDNQPKTLQQVKDSRQLLSSCFPVVQAMLNTFVRV